MTLSWTDPDPLAGVPLDDRLLRWGTTLRDRLVNLELRSMGRGHGDADHRARDLGDLLVTDWRCPELVGERTTTMADQEAESLLLFMVTEGRQLVEAGDRTVLLRPGAMLLMRTRTTGRVVIQGDLAKCTVRIPLTALAPYDTGPGVPDLMSLEIADNPLAQVTRGFLAGIDAQPAEMSATDVEVARHALLVLVAGMVRGNRPSALGGTDFLPLLRKRLEQWIGDHLTAGAIHVRDLAAAHHVAPRTINRAFAATGDTMRAVVRAHRLAAARHDLVHTDASIAAIAHRWGFCDASHLSREFRREFSLSPGDYRDAHGIASGPAAAVGHVAAVDLPLRRPAG